MYMALRELVEPRAFALDVDAEGDVGELQVAADGLKFLEGGTNEDLVSGGVAGGGSAPKPDAVRLGLERVVRISHFFIARGHGCICEHLFYSLKRPSRPASSFKNEHQEHRFSYN